MGIRQQFLKAYHKCPFTAIRDVVIPLVSWIFDIVLYCHLANEYSKSITKEAEFACRQSHNIKVQRACRHLSTDLHAAPVFFLSCVTHTVVVHSIFYGFPRTWFIRRLLKLGTYNLVCIGVVLYGYFYSEIAFETSLPFLIIRVFVCIVYHIFTSVMWCCDKWCRKGDKRKPEKNEELVVEQLQVTTVHIHSGKTRLQRLREIQSRRTVSEEQPNEILVTTPKKLSTSASLP
ncbi:hypothetical protein L596_009775 [Steinernema carpocapsae]|uniref:Uncharacterized protein n=1 Tax=Steinernema carpocapsae TaxID=34508 RepID=A0A4U5PHN1_STECR|nr:hypothetical protein L596_009775 [Steinernema carpocapsae]